MRRNLVRQCIKCGRIYGEKEPFKDKGVTHGYCPGCYEEEMEKLEERIRMKERRNPMARRRTIFYLPFRVDTWFERDRAHVGVYDAKDNNIFDAWDEAVGELVEDGFLEGRDIKGSALDYAASLLGFKDYYDLETSTEGKTIRARKTNPPIGHKILESEIRRFDKSPTNYISSAGLDPNQFPGVSKLKYQITFSEREAEDIDTPDDAIKWLLKKIMRRY